MNKGLPTLKLPRLSLILFLTIALGVLSACDTAAERAEKHYQSALALIEKGDEERALVELRNVFQLNGQHHEARKLFASLQRERGDVREAIGQYLRLVEQLPEDLEGQRALAELFLSVGNWPESARHADAALSLDADDPRSRAVRAVLDYGSALEARDEKAAAEAVVAVRELRTELPDNLPLRQVIIDELVRASDYMLALEELDGAIELQPNNKDLLGMRVSVLSALGDDEAVEDAMISFVAQFPEDDVAALTLVRWYLSRGQVDDAESFMRANVDPEDENRRSQLALVRFLSEMRGRDAAISELDAMIAAGDDAPVLTALRAGLVDDGQREAGIAAMRATLDGMNPSDEARNIKVALSRMLLATGNNVGARSNIEEVLAEDPGHVEALKLKADWLIRDDEVSAAVTALRAALSRSPNDADIMSLMARAHEREGNPELVGEMLSLAVEASNNAPEESVRYAEYLANRDRLVTAETVLIDALRLAPENLRILEALGNIYVAMKDWGRAEQVAATLERLDFEEARQIGRSLTARTLQAQNRSDEAISYLQGLVDSGDAGLGANVEIIRSLLSAGDFDAARSQIKTLAGSEPDNPQVKFIEAAVDMAAGDLDSAEATYRALLESEGSQPQIWIALFRLLDSQRRDDEMRAAMDEAIINHPEDRTLQWIQAGILEKSGQIDEAIGIYQSMYETDSDNLIVANNLASLLADNRTDEASLERAYTIARRLRGTDVPPFQDTFGWISHLRGDTQEARDALEPAAASLSEDPLVQYHLAQVYVSLELPELALDQFLKVVDLTSAADTRPFVETSRQEINRLKSEQDAPANQ